ncbi:hypothetical protein ACLOJK_038435 [Asimina triloba]
MGIWRVKNPDLTCGCHGDLTSEESQILLAELSLRHSKTAVRIAHEYAKRKLDNRVSVH